MKRLIHSDSSVPSESLETFKTPLKDGNKNETEVLKFERISPENKKGKKIPRCLDISGSKFTEKESIVQPLKVNALVTSDLTPAVKSIYKIIQKCTGSLGGNAYFGAIYGEATMNCMKQVIEIMKEHCNFSGSSSFIDIGSGLGKPCFHVAQDPGVKISYGIELEEIRHNLAVHNMRHILQYTETNHGSKHGNVFLQHGDIQNATTLDPFTHIYMFDVGFPPLTLLKIAEIFNRSQAPFLICYHSPKLVIEEYGFNVQFVTKYQVSLHGSGERHTGYVYSHSSKTIRDFDNSIIDPLFQEGVKMIQSNDPGKLIDYFNAQNQAYLSTQTRSRRTSSLL